MPTYSYACTVCGHRFDAQQAFTDDPLTECPECSSPLRKLFGNVGVVFKGSGFYRTDARRDAKADGAPKRTAAPATSESSSGSSSESSPGSSSESSSGSAAAPAAAATG